MNFNQMFDMLNPKLILLLLAFCSIQNANCQESEQKSLLPVIVPPSPDIAGFDRIASLSTGMHTGSASVNIPLFEIKSGNISVPVSLTYNTNGVRVNDIASRVGMGWNLLAGGTISRTIHDEADYEPDVTRLVPPASFDPQETNNDLYNYLVDGTKKKYDTERDEYSFNFNGYSGRFYIDDANVIRQMDQTNLKIERFVGGLTSFIITDANGIKYYFGGGFFKEYDEWTRGYTVNGIGRENKESQTGWFLKKIVTPEDNWIQFTYTPVQSETLLGPSQSMILKPLDNHENEGYCNITNPCESDYKNPLQNVVKYNTNALSSISSSSGIIAYFMNESRNDAGGDVRLKSLIIQDVSANASRTVKSFTFDYEAFQIVGDYNDRFYLKKLTQLPISFGTVPENGSTSPNCPVIPLEHKFEYNDCTFPSQKSYNQDYFGYNNGTNNLGFVEFPPDTWNWENGWRSADRKPNFYYMTHGSLKKVEFPTGGTEEFEYEQHRVPEFGHDTIYNQYSISGTGLTSPRQANVITHVFNTGTNPLVQLDFEVLNNPGYTPYIPQDGLPLATIRLERVSDNQTVTDGFKKYYTYSTDTKRWNSYHLQANTEYRIRIEIFNIATRAYATIKYNPTLNPKWLEKLGCGMRVKRIKAFDPVSNTTTNKYFRYASLEDITKSSGQGPTRFTSFQDYIGGGRCTAQGVLSASQVECISFKQISASSITRSGTFGSSPIAYSYVIESDDEYFLHGGVEHKFYTVPNANAAQIIFGSIMNSPTFTIGNDLNGREIKTTIFKKNGLQFTKLSETENEYTVDPRDNHTIYNYLVSEKWSPFGLAFNYMSEKILRFDLSSYRYTSSWYYLSKTKQTTYDENGENPMLQETDYEYASAIHRQPTKILTTNSTGDILRKEIKYSSDFPTENLYTQMVAQNILAPEIETTTWKNNTLISTSKIQYFDFSSNGTIFKPQTLSISKGTSPTEIRLRNHQYDSKGNLLQVSLENGSAVSYIWDYAGSLPVAEVKNATHTDIAYSSFETQDYSGNWQKQGTEITSPNGDFSNYHVYYNTEKLTGRVSYGGTVSKVIATSKAYIVSLWSKGPVPAVSNAIPVFVTQVNGWSNYIYNIPLGNSTVTVQGSMMDEVRLYPATALMTTYNYNPNIGLSSVQDAAGNLQFYDYDVLNRLILVRDMDKNIVKQIDYCYARNILPCTNNVAQWTATGRTRCELDASNGYTGEKKAEERDENNCSLTYLQPRWVTIPTPSGECTGTPYCVGADKRIVNGVCEQGSKILVSSHRVGTVWYCTFKYVWSDNYEGPEFTETNNNGCVGMILID